MSEINRKYGRFDNRKIEQFYQIKKKKNISSVHTIHYLQKRRSNRLQKLDYLSALNIHYIGTNIQIWEQVQIKWPKFSVKRQKRTHAHNDGN